MGPPRLHHERSLNSSPTMLMSKIEKRRRLEKWQEGNKFFSKKERQIQLDALCCFHFFLSSQEKVTRQTIRKFRRLKFIRFLLDFLADDLLEWFICSLTDCLARIILLLLLLIIIKIHLLLCLLTSDFCVLLLSIIGCHLIRYWNILNIGVCLAINN